jgi:hypothetical protein
VHFEGERVAPLKEKLTKFIVTSRKPKAVLEATKEVVGLLESGPLDESSKLGDWDVRNSLIALGIARRGRNPKMLELAVDRDELNSALADLESLVSDNVILPEKLNAKPPYLPNEIGVQAITLRAWYMRSGWNMISLPKLSTGNVQTDTATYYIVPRSTLSDLLLEIHVESEWYRSPKEEWFLRLWWRSPESLYREMMEGASLHIERTSAKPAELSNYTFDRKIQLAGELRSKLSSVCIREVRQLRGILFETEEDVGEHSKVVDSLISLGRLLGYEAKAEVDIGGGRIDVVWRKDGNPECFFEVVLEGSLEEALFRLSRVEGRQFLVVRGMDRASVEERVRKLGFKGKVLEVEKVAAASLSLGSLELLQ